MSSTTEDLREDVENFEEEISRLEGMLKEKERIGNKDGFKEAVIALIYNKTKSLLKDDIKRALLEVIEEEC